MKKFAVVLSGCGVRDGSEIHEAVLTMLAIAQQGAQYQVFAPDVTQHDVVNHLTGKPTEEKRNVLVESARIARGNAKPLSQFDPKAYDALILPGGFGAAKNLCSFALDGADARVNPDVTKAIQGMKALGKPIGALCIAPVVIAKVLSEVTVTIGNDAGTATAIAKMGAHHQASRSAEVVVDRRANVFTTPCYMMDVGIDEIAKGAGAIVKAMLDAIG